MTDLDEISARLGSPDEEARRLAVVALRAHPFPVAMRLLFSAMGDQSWRVRKEAVTVVLQARPLDNTAIESLIELLRASDNAGLRNSAVESLERIGAAAVEPLCGHLNDPDQDLRKFVIDILGNIRSASCVPLLVKALDDDDMNVRVAAAENLGKIRDPRALPHLVAVLEGGEVWLKFTVLDALALIGAPVPLVSLAPLLRENLLRRATYDCLGALGDIQCLPILLQGLQEKAKNAREAAVVALMRVRGRLAAQELSRVDLPLQNLEGGVVAKKLIDSLHTEDPAVLDALVRLIAIMRDGRAALPLLQVCRIDRLRGVCLEAFRSIGQSLMPDLVAHYPVASAAERTVIVHLIAEFGESDHHDLIVAGLADDSSELRRCCASALGKLAVPGAVPRLAELLEDEEQSVREAALEALQGLCGSERAALNALCAELLLATLPRKRRDAAVILGALADGDRLCMLVKDEDATVRRAAVASLARVDLPELSHLALALSDEEPEVRLAAAQALSDRGGSEVLGPLLLALNDADRWVQAAALKGLSSLGDPAALPGVTALLDQANGPVLIAALSTLAALGGAQALAPVEQALSHSDEEVVEAAIRILSGFGGGWINGHSEALLGHPHWMVRRCFVRALGELRGEGAVALLDQALAREPDPLVKGEIAETLDRLR